MIHATYKVIMRRTLIAWIFLAMSFSSKSLLASEFVVDGIVLFQLTNTAGQIAFLREDSFSVHVRDCYWRLRKIPIRHVTQGKERTDLEESFEASSDLTNFYHITSFNPANFAKARYFNASGITNQPAGIPPANSASGYMGNGSVPYGIPDTAAIVLWYAFASECYLAGVTNNYIHPTYMLKNVGDYAKDFRVAAEWEISKMTPKLPLWIRFSIYKRFQESEDLPHRQELLDSTNCFLKVHRFTNVAGNISLPSEISLTSYTLPVRSNHVVHVAGATVWIRVTNVFVGSKRDDFTLSLDRKTLITDLRPVKVDAPVVAATGIDTNWPKLSSSEARYTFALAKYRHDRLKRASHFKLSRFAAAALFLSPVALFVFVKWITKTKKTKERT